MPSSAATCVNGRPLPASSDTASRLNSSVNVRRVLLVIRAPRSPRSLSEVSTQPGEGQSRVWLIRCSRGGAGASMALGRQGGRQTDLMVGWAELPRSPGHAFYDRLQEVLVEAGFDGFAENQCAPYYASKRGRPSLPPGRYFRMHLIGYFEGIDSERGLE